MKKYLKFLFSILIFSIFEISVSYPQSVIATAGGNSSGTGGAVSYTVGQIVYSEVSGTNVTLLQGIQHFFGNPPLGIQKFSGAIPDITVFPNPSSDFIKLKSEDYMMDNFTFKLYNPKGAILFEKKIESAETDISIKNYTPGTYILVIFRNGVPVKTFKIIRN